MHRVLRSLGTLVLVAGLAGCLGSARPAVAGPYRGLVIDAETKEPLAGAVVMIYWNFYALVSGHPDSFLDSEEAVTGPHGEFSVGAHAPRAPYPGTTVSRARISILKPGGAPFPFGHTAPPWPPRGEDELLQMMQQRPIVIELPRLKSRAEAERMLDLLDPFAVPQERIPKMMRAFYTARRQLYRLP